MRRKKLTFDEFVKKFDYNSFNESAFQNKKTGKFVHGWRYYLTEQITEEQKTFLEQFKNVKVSYDVVFIGNSCFEEA